jgi:methylglyoxal synthase
MPSTHERACPCSPWPWLITQVAHDKKKAELLAWATANKDKLSRHALSGTGTTGLILEQALGLPVQKYLSGPLGGDQQIGASIATGGIDLLVFFWDPLEPQPHDPDVKALLRLAVLWNVPIANNTATADFMFSSPLLDAAYDNSSPDYARYSKLHAAVAHEVLGQ